jgi:hypothetical protein
LPPPITFDLPVWGLRELSMGGGLAAQSTVGGADNAQFLGSIGNFIKGLGSGNSEFTIGDKPFDVIGGTQGNRSQVEADLRAVFQTPRGAQMLAQLETRRSFFLFRRDFVVDLTVTSNAYTYPGYDTLFVDPNFHPVIQTTRGPLPASTLRILAHELGHAVFGTLDDGPGRMNNVRQNENAVMRALGHPERTVY